MRNFKKYIICVAIGVGFGLGGSAHASGGFAGATEATQMLNNGLLTGQLAEAAETVTTLHTKLQKQLEMLRIDKLMSEALSGMIPQAALQAGMAEFQNIMKMRDSLSRLRGGLDSLKGSFESRFNEAQLQGISWERYVLNEEKSLKQKNQRAVQRMNEEKAYMDEVAKDHQLVQEFGSKISGTKGVHQSVALLNSQMNRVIQQNARLTEVMAKAYGTDLAIKEAEEASKIRSDMKIVEGMNKRNLMERVRLENAFSDYDPASYSGQKLSQ